MPLTNYVLMPGADYQAACDAIRAKTGKSELIKSGELATEIEAITGGSSGSESGDERVKYVTFMYNGEELIKYPVISGDTCRDPVSLELIDVPTKESTVQYDYTHSGWSLTSGGSANASALSNVTADRVVYAAFKSEVCKYTITYLDDDGVKVLKTESLAYGAMPSYAPMKEGHKFNGWNPAVESVTGDMTYQAQWVELNIASMSWDEISQISQAGDAANYFDVGDCKAVHLNGTIGTLNLDTTLYVFILGFDHNSSVEGSGITFGCFKTAETNGKDVALIDSNYSNRKTDGTKTFSMNHWGQSNYGGWAGCDMRYDILGSTDVPPSDYGTKPTNTRTGNNPSESCTSNPVANTLMAALPTDLRSVLKPITKYTNNKDMTSNATIDYLPLLSLYEIFGTTLNTNNYEYNANNQKRYAYYENGGSRDKYKHSSTGSYVLWWPRSKDKNRYTTFNYVNSGNTSMPISAEGSNYSIGISPIFLV